MNTQEQKLAQGKPYLQKLKDLGMGFTMDRVCGDRVLIAPIQPFTEMDKVEKSGLLYVPDSVKATNEARDQLLQMQDKGQGSWDGDGIGKTYGTAIALIILQLPYKYLPVYQR